MSGRTADAVYEVYALRYATHAERRSAANYLGEDPHDNAPMPLDFYVWVIRNPARTLLVDTGFSADMAVRRGRRYLARRWICSSRSASPPRASRTSS